MFRCAPTTTTITTNNRFTTLKTNCVHFSFVQSNSEKLSKITKIRYTVLFFNCIMITPLNVHLVFGNWKELRTQSIAAH